MRSVRWPWRADCLNARLQCLCLWVHQLLHYQIDVDDGTEIKSPVEEAVAYKLRHKRPHEGEGKALGQHLPQVAPHHVRQRPRRRKRPHCGWTLMTESTKSWRNFRRTYATSLLSNRIIVLYAEFPAWLVLNPTYTFRSTNEQCTLPVKHLETSDSSYFFFLHFRLLRVASLCIKIYNNIFRYLTCFLPL